MAMMSGLEGRKSIIYVSSGLSMTPGIGLMHEYVAAFHDTAFLGRRAQTDRTRPFPSLTSPAPGALLARSRADFFGFSPTGYPISAAGDDRVHRIEVELPGHPHCDVRY